ncbi:hypothetical protein LF1_50100 [Rubripirellula obstinata]|uniref:von Willebrand factor type A domain protein n=1 Tax=Rubripirellula obstinata TaxID=406547 RepID=A0A5B1CPG2_9BACT|nr:hypothetical protein [Rubripirellula obstinata]KAA1262446.1 hypothetical protein LF1_50100 [Rubripirellula obstinata]
MITPILQPSIADTTQRQIIYEFTRATTLEGWWMWATLLVGLAALLYACVRYYRRDTTELSSAVRVTLMMLRLATIAALVFFFFNLNRRTQRMLTRPSEVVILVDTSQSMSLPSTSAMGSQSRDARAAAILGKSDLIDSLASNHRVSVYAFGDASEPTLLETRSLDSDDPADSNTDAANQSSSTDTYNTSTASSIAILAAALIAIGLLLGVVSLLIGAFGSGSSKPVSTSPRKASQQPTPSPVGPWILASAICLFVGIVGLGAVASVYTDQSLAEILGAASSDQTDEENDDDDENQVDAPEQTVERIDDWSTVVAATAPESHIGDALRGVLADHDPSTLAGIVLLSDGQGNGGSDAASAITVASRSEVAVYPVGLGSSDAPVNVRVVDLDAPRRVYPGDKFAVTAVLQASGPEPIAVDVQLIDGLDVSANGRSSNSSRSSDSNQSNSDSDESGIEGRVVDTQRVTINNDGTLSGIRFEIEPESVGRRRLAIRVVPPAADQNKRDDLRSTRYEVVSRKLRVLAIAGGPTREYRFVRNLLFRDKSIELDAWLQTGQKGISQDADNLVTEFPPTAEALFEYDAIAMFDPDWTAISAEQLDLLDRWLSQQAGGMVLVAGPVYHPRWIRRRTDPRVSRIAGFFPVNVSTGSTLLSRGRQGGDTAWPIALTPEARRAEFLWIDETPESSFDVWENFSGVYDYTDSKSAKPGAKVYGYYSDPTTELGGSLPVYLASQFYGAGRVFFQGSGEMWRLRGESDAYFDSYYTKLIRWVSEGRLLRDSNRGILLLDSTRAMVGDTVTVRAVLTDEQFEPLDVPAVPAKLLVPSGRIEDLTLTPLEGEPRAGTYGGRFIVREAGNYEIRLTLGDALEEQLLRQNVQVRLPTIELERPRRNDTELNQYATITGGQYFPIDNATTDTEIADTLNETLKPQPQTTILPGTPDIDFTRRTHAALMWLIATMLSMEWITRRLHRLA